MAQVSILIHSGAPNDSKIFDEEAGTRFGIGDDSMPTDAEIAEAERQIEEVRAKYKDTPLYMKAPNGKHTKLTERQWLQVRTPNFKKWFGDWETLAEYNFLNGEEVARITGNEILGYKERQIVIPNVLSYWTDKYADFKTEKENEYSFKSKTTNVEVLVNEETIKATISKKGRLGLKREALACIGEIIEDGMPLNFSRDWKGKGHQSFILSAPIQIGKEKCIASVVVKRERAEKHKDGTEKFNKPIAYVIDSIEIKKLTGQTNPVGQLNAMGVGVNTPVNLIDNTLQNIWNVNKKDVSKVVDENGEPIIVSLEVNKNRQGFGEITDLLMAHPKESFGRIIDWAKKGRCIYWDKQKGRKLLQDTSPANRERYETELAPFLPSQSENTWENQEENAKYSKNFAESGESAALGDENGKYREGANEFCVKMSGFTLSEVQEFYNSADAKFRTASVLIDKFQQNSLQLLVDGGLVSKESAKEMAKNFGYVSFRRLMEFPNSEAGFFNSSYLTIAKRFAIFQEIWI